MLGGEVKGRRMPRKRVASVQTPERVHKKKSKIYWRVLSLKSKSEKEGSNNEISLSSPDTGWVPWQANIQPSAAAALFHCIGLQVSSIVYSLCMTGCRDSLPKSPKHLAYKHIKSG